MEYQVKKSRFKDSKWADEGHSLNRNSLNRNFTVHGGNVKPLSVAVRPAFTKDVGRGTMKTKRCNLKYIMYVRHSKFRCIGNKNNLF